MESPSAGSSETGAKDETQSLVGAYKANKDTLLEAGFKEEDIAARPGDVLPTVGQARGLVRSRIITELISGADPQRLLSFYEKQLSEGAFDSSTYESVRSGLSSTVSLPVKDDIPIHEVYRGAPSLPVGHPVRAFCQRV